MEEKEFSIKLNEFEIGYMVGVITQHIDRYPNSKSAFAPIIKKLMKFMEQT